MKSISMKEALKRKRSYNKKCREVTAFLPKKGNYVRYIYDLPGNILGRIEVDDAGDSRAYSQNGELLGFLSKGSTYKPNGELIMNADVLNSLLFTEDRIEI